MDHLLTSHDDPKEMSLIMFTSHGSPPGSHLKGNFGKYCAGYAIGMFLSMATLAQKAESYTVTHTLTLAKGKTVNVYIHSRYAFEEAQDFRMWW